MPFKEKVISLQTRALTVNHILDHITILERFYRITERRKRQNYMFVHVSLSSVLSELAEEEVVRHICLMTRYTMILSNLVISL